ncbi:bifunctional DNA primase/polymerase [Tepidiforma sp.]|uniref:bifunctional DNA primase/polymerase n=1 Tax=Tepidiforma sp. TaxID=2682230 RepID=UPI00262272F3|nr:bifunctional DNA primase/polymerase [Tepidiforma sp.]MCX7618334.1 bifunctional DNA primase/polymerase [Tepidiforma sp.]
MADEPRRPHSDGRGGGDASAPYGSELFEAARSYARRGWAVLPLKPRGKEPLTEHGVKDATTDLDTIEEWWRRWPKANVGIATGAVSGLVVLDIDPRNGGDEALRGLLAQHGGWGVPTDGGYPETWTVLTGGGGQHYYFAIDGPVPSRKLAEGVDLKGDDGYVVAPPSVHPSGRPYMAEASTEHLSPAPAPAWLLGAAGARKAPLYRELEGEPVHEGRRNAYLASLAGKLRHDRLSTEEIAATLLAVNSTRCLPPLPEDEVRSIAASIARYEPGRPAEAELSAADGAGEEYFADGQGTWRRRRGREGEEVVEQLANFTARITADVTVDDGAEQVREFELEAIVAGRTVRAEVRAEEFEAMRWPVAKLGPEAQVAAGPSKRDHLRAAIQAISSRTGIARRHVYAHLGWREADGRHAFLHAGGAIGAEGLEVRLPAELERFVLPAPPGNDELRAAIRGALQLLGVAPYRVTVPLLAAAILPPLLVPDFAIHLAGPTGARKTELAALAQRFYGAGMDARHLPASWRSTANALEVLAFLAKDCLLVVDDFVPAGSAGDASRLYREAEQLLRAAGNHAGRQRLTRDARLRAARPPRCLVLSTGEDIPPGHSLRARTWVVEVEPDDVDLERLTELQQLAADGVFARAMAGYLAWLAPQLDTRRTAARACVEARMAELATGRHGRTAAAQAALEVALSAFLEFAVAAGAVAGAEADGLKAQAVEALGSEGAAAQAAAQRESDPARRFIDLVRSALGSGLAHVANRDGGTPPLDDAGAWGWRQMPGRDGWEWRPQGACIGWLDGAELYFDPDAALRVAQAAAPAGESLGATRHAMSRALRHTGLLASIEQRRETATVRRTLGGAQRNVWHLRAAAVSAGLREGVL